MIYKKNVLYCIMAFIITMLYGCCKPAGVERQMQAKVDGTKIEMQFIKEHLDRYKTKYGSYPSTQEGLGALISKNIVRSDKRLKDMWGKMIELICIEGSPCVLKSYGADGRPGGSGFNQDIIIVMKDDKN